MSASPWPGVPCRAPKLERGASRVQSELRYGVREGVADAIEGVANGVREALHRGNGAETDQSSNQCVLDQILTGIFRHQVLENLCHVLHFCFSSCGFSLGIPREGGRLCDTARLGNGNQHANHRKASDPAPSGACSLPPWFEGLPLWRDSSDCTVRKSSVLKEGTFRKHCPCCEISKQDRRERGSAAAFWILRYRSIGLYSVMKVNNDEDGGEARKAVHEWQEPGSAVAQGVSVRGERGANSEIRERRFAGAGGGADRLE